MFPKKISCVLLILFFTLIPTLVQGATKTDDVIVFANKAIESATRKILNKETGNITKEDVLNITEFDIRYYVNDIYNRITTLTDLRWFQNLKSLELSSCSLQDITGIEELVNLQHLNLSYNCITSIEPVRNLINLTYFDCSYNVITDYSPITNLTKLETLYIGNNGMGRMDLSMLKGLTNLRAFEASNSEISDISPLANLKKLQTLNLSSNDISDISPLKDLKNLYRLDIYNNNISDISPLKNLENLDSLDVSSNPISENDMNKFYEPKESDYFTNTSTGKINDDMDEFTFDLSGFYDRKTREYSIETLTITDNSNRKVIQKIQASELFSSLGFENYFYDKYYINVTLFDLNLDGYKDIVLLGDYYSSYNKIFLLWNNSIKSFEIDENLSKIPNIQFDETNGVFYGRTSGSSYEDNYSSTYKYIDGVLTPIRYYSREYMGNSEKIARILEEYSLKANIGISRCYHEKVSELNEKTGKMEVVLDEYVFYTDDQYYSYYTNEIIVARFNASSEIGEIIKNSNFYQ